MNDVIMQNINVCSEVGSSSVGVNAHEDQHALQIALQLSNLALLGCYEDGCDDASKLKATPNMTECVPVPSSEHVAEIVGKQGCKIKALRAKTNTYIKTPVRGEEPVFVVTGRKEDVALARREVQSAAEHFTQIRASRNRHAIMTGQAVITSNDEGCPGTITLQVRVPYRVVGLVVGPKGATIKRIQQQTHTYIVTPSRDKEPVFEVTGLPENVEKAKEEIDAHIAARTAPQPTSIDEDFKNNGIVVGSPTANDILYVDGTSNSTFNANSNSGNTSLLYDDATSKSILRSNAPSFYPSRNPNQTVVSLNQEECFADCYAANAVSKMPFARNLDHASASPGQQPVQWSAGYVPDYSNSFQSLFACGMTGTSERGTSASPASSISAQLSRMSPVFSDKEFPALQITNRYPMHRVASEESSTSSVPTADGASSSVSLNSSASTAAINMESGYSSGSPTGSVASGSPSESNLSSITLETKGVRPRLCVVCERNVVTVAMVPCGHHLYCHFCANEILEKPDPCCPSCHQVVSMVLPIKK